MTQANQLPATGVTTPDPAAVARLEQTTLRTHTVGALPILNHILQRLQLEEILHRHLPHPDARSKLPNAQGLLVLVKNLLLAREPVYGLGEWAARYHPHFLGLTPRQLAAVNDDRVGRCLTILFHSDRPALLLELVRHVVREFQVSLDELHNDSTSIAFHGDYPDAAAEKQRRDQRTLAITWGHSKDHRPDLKQLLYILTISNDGGVPIHFRAASGNVTDDRTHCANWDLLCQIAGRCDFLYVADCKLATMANMNYIDSHGGRFVSVLPRTRKEDAAFRERLRREEVAWQPLWEKCDDDGKVIDRFTVIETALILPEGYRLWWYHSSHKAELDLNARSQRLQRAELHLQQLQQKLRSPRSRQRDRGQIQDAVQKILQRYDVADFMRVDIRERQEESYHQERRGRPGPNTAYIKTTRTRYDLDYRCDAEALVQQRQCDGIFPLVCNDAQMTALPVLHAYKHQPQIEKRFEQLKTDFSVAPVYLKDVGRIEALFCMYFIVLMVEALLEREMRQAMTRAGLESLPLYPEGRACCRPTTRRLLDVFEGIQSHTLQQGETAAQTLVTELTPLQCQLVRLLGLSTEGYGR